MRGPAEIAMRTPTKRYVSGIVSRISQFFCVRLKLTAVATPVSRKSAPSPTSDCRMLRTTTFAMVSWSTSATTILGGCGAMAKTRFLMDAAAAVAATAAAVAPAVVAGTAAPDQPHPAPAEGGAIARLQAKIQRLEDEVHAIEAQTEEHTNEADGLEKRLTELTIQTNAAARQRKDGGRKENAQISQALKLLTAQMELMEEEIRFLTDKNERVRSEIAAAADAHRARKLALVRRLDDEQARASGLGADAARLEERCGEVEARLAQAEQDVRARAEERALLQQTVGAVDALCDECRAICTRGPDAGLVQSLAAEADEVRGEIVKLLITAFESPVKFCAASGEAQYKELLRRLTKKKAQIGEARELARVAGR